MPPKAKESVWGHLHCVFRGETEERKRMEAETEAGRMRYRAVPLGGGRDPLN